jgi:hypothetical protein
MNVYKDQVDAIIDDLNDTYDMDTVDRIIALAHVKSALGRIEKRLMQEIDGASAPVVRRPSLLKFNQQLQRGHRDNNRITSTDH